MNVLLTALTLALLVLSNASTDGVFYAQPGAQARVGLEVETAPGLAINRKNPPVIALSSPFEPGVVLTAEVTGQPWSPDPETYLARLDPVVWTLNVPEDAKPGAYPLIVEADFSLCDTAVGVCFTEHRELGVTLHVGTAGSNKAARVFLSTPEF